jgi:D-alanyl-D-alanine carboxypeptidase
MVNTTFKNASGLHHDRQISTAADMSRMGRVLINNYNQYYSYFSRKSFRYKGVTYNNHNKLMRTYKGMDGLKTGYTSKSGFNLVASAKRDGNRIIGVVFGGRTGNSRNSHMKVLLDRGFRQMDRLHLADLRDMPHPVRKPQMRIASAATQNIEPSSGAYSPKSIPSFSKQNLSLWSVQIGAFKSRVKTDNLLQDAIKVLPSQLQAAYPIIAPLRTASSGWMFRARLAGLTQDEAQSACNYFNDCLVVAPKKR